MGDGSWVRNYKIVYMLNLQILPDLALSARQTKTDTCANSVDPDETVPEMTGNEPSDHVLHCLPSCFRC